MGLVIFLILLCFCHTTPLSIAPNQNKFYATCQEISPDILAKMIYTWNDDSPVPLKDLRYLTLSFYDFNGNIHRDGELVVHRLVVDDVIDIFEKLFEAKFPITSMRLIDFFNGSDEDSMAANNTSAFYARRVADTTRWSNHSFGTALDINPLLNPYTRGNFFCPQEGKRYLDRTLNEPGMITPNSYICQVFKEKGWEYGGECFYERDGTLDLHHFQKVIPGVNKNTN